MHVRSPSALGGTPHVLSGSITYRGGRHSFRDIGGGGGCRSPFMREKRTGSGLAYASPCISCGPALPSAAVTGIPNPQDIVSQVTLTDQLRLVFLECAFRVAIADGELTRGEIERLGEFADGIRIRRDVLEFKIAHYLQGIPVVPIFMPNTDV